MMRAVWAAAFVIGMPLVIVVFACVCELIDRHRRRRLTIGPGPDETRLPYNRDAIALHKQQ